MRKTRTPTTIDAAPARGDGPPGADGSVEAIRNAALSVFGEQGFAGSSIRELAASSNMSVAGIYHHFPSKLEILFDLMTRTMEGLVDRTNSALDEAGVDAGSRLAAAVRAHVLFHTEERAASFVYNTELRSLDPRRREKIVAQRDAYQRTWFEIVSEGRRRGEFDVDDVAAVTRALLTMCTAVYSWYRKDGPSTPDEIADFHCEMARRMVGHNQAATDLVAGSTASRP
ncbi:MAG: TetR/AcrR family transcriptional regulator [Gaiellaceae bacterium]